MADPATPGAASVGSGGDPGSPAALPAVEAPSAAPAAGSVDAVTFAQRRLDELAVLMYTYVGVVQRDAPPAARAPDEADVAREDAAAREMLCQRAPEYAADLVRASTAVGEAVGRVEKEVLAGGGADEAAVRERLVRADERCAVVGNEMKAEAARVEVLLGRVREAIAVTEEDY